MSELAVEAIIDNAGRDMEADFRVLDASLDERVAKIAAELATSNMGLGQVMQLHMLEAVEIASDHKIPVNMVDLACLISLIRKRKAENAHEA